MKKRTLIRIISFFVAGAIVIVCAFATIHIKENTYYAQISQTYSRFMEELAVSVNNINTLLEKSMYITSATQLNTLATQMYHQCETAKNALSQLPSYSAENSGINKFLSQTGNYMLALAKSTIQKGEIPSEQRTNIEKLRDYSNKLKANIDELEIHFTDIRWLKEVQQSITKIDEELNFAEEITETEQTLTDYPTLIYDGPYSDHILNDKPQYLDESENISQMRAMEIAADALEIDKNDIIADGEENGEIPAYKFLAKDCSIAVSKSGGHIVYFRKTPLGGTTLFTQEQAVEIAEEYLKRHSSLTFEASYSFSDEGTCTINFAYRNGATVCYTDLIKVGVCLNSGEVVMVEARGFLMNHKERIIRTPAYTVEQAQAALNESLKPVNVTQVLIPVQRREVHCYEFICNGKNSDKILVYINTQTLEEEQIYILMETNGGSLVK